MAPKKKGSFLSRGRDRVKQTRQMKDSAKRQLPPKGGTGANKPKATAQRTATAVTQRVRQDVATLQALGENMKRNQARAERQITADKSPSVRRVGPGGANPKPQGQLPSGQRGGDLATRGGALATRDGGSIRTRGGQVTPPRSNGGPVRQVSVQDMGKPQRPALPGQRSLPGGTGGGDRVTGSGVRTGRPGAPRPALPAAATRASTPKPPAGGRINIGGLRGGLIGLAGGMAADYVGTKAGEAIGGFLRDQTNKPKEDKRSNRPGGGSSNSTAKLPRPAGQYEKLFDPGGGRGNYGLDKKPQPVAPLPASVRQSSSGGSGSGGSTPRRSGSTSPARKASTSPTPPSERRVSASTANRESGNYGTSKTNNSLMKDMVGRIKDREDKAQASAAKNLTSKFNTESNFSGEKVDGSKVDTKAKINSTTSEYDKKKRRYGG